MQAKRESSFLEVRTIGANGRCAEGEVDGHATSSETIALRGRLFGRSQA